MKFGKDLIYVSIYEPTCQVIYNLIKVMITSNHPWSPVSINDKLECNITFPQYDEADDVYKEPNYDHNNRLLIINTIDRIKAKLDATIQWESNFIN